MGWASWSPGNTNDKQDVHPTKPAKSSRKYATPVINRLQVLFGFPGLNL
ncbi:MAG: hypothetical protein V7K15_05805 [Nostoc sp.]